MSKPFRDFLYDILEKSQPFKEEITHVIMKRDDLGDVVARVVSSVLSLSVTSAQEIPDFRDIACFGSLKYLHTLLKSKYMRGDAKFDIVMNYRTTSNGKTEAVRNMSIKAGRMQSFYQATDPYINNLHTKISKPKVKDWLVMFPITKEAVSEFEEVAKIHAMADKLGGERDDIFSLGYDGEGNIIASFGEKGHQSSVILTEDAEAVDSDLKINALFSIRHFRGLLNMMGDKEMAIMSLAQLGVQIETESAQATYKASLTAKKRIE